GSDADHLKTAADIDVTAAAGFRMFTIDPGEHVDNEADHDDGATCRAKFDKLPWDELEISAADCRETYHGRTFKLPGGLSLYISEAEVKGAAVKYGRAILHTVKMDRHVKSVCGKVPFELEMSVDETATPTSPAEHYFVANELRRLGVRPVSLAPRFVGKFEKGVDYQGDIGEFRRQFALHAAIARELGPYKISLHSGSDKFSIYPICAELTGGLVHLKTAGTSYLEALRAIARVQPGLFREILGFAIERYETDKASYHVSADLTRVKRPEQLADGELETVLDDFHGRQVLHVTFGSVLTATAKDGRLLFKDRLVGALKEHEAAHYEAVTKHLKRHVSPFVGG
ncbi:MAG: tagaturonate epimerase family protein, partial [Phycisphaerae bacterium]|nr:tagaturonate epimerase family protein [Phycisphaerae bacterium]